MRLSRANKKGHRRGDAGEHVSVPSDQGVVRVPVQALPYVPTKATKTWVAFVVTLAGLLGIHLTSGAAQAVVMVVQLVLVVFGVWRARNAYAPGPKGPGVGEFL